MIAFRQHFLSYMVDKTSGIYTKLFKKNSLRWNLSKLDLKHYEPNTLGYQLYQFLEEKNIDLMPKHESHDLFHVITGYDISGIEECRLQFFLLGNGKCSIYLLLSLAMAIILFPEKIIDFKKHIQRGQRANRFYDWDFENLLHQNFEILNHKIYNHENVPTPR
jgi:ubiquinone biosynthesis protein Coq4